MNNIDNKLVKLTLHGDLGKKVGRKWEFAVKSVQQAIGALNTITNNKFSNYFRLNNKLQAKYRVLINGKDFTCHVKQLDESNVEMINQSEIVMKKENLETIDIVPFLESQGAKGGGIGTLIVGVILIIVGIFLVWNVGSILIGMGIGLIAAGVSVLLTLPPAIGKDAGPERAGGRSYLFNGPINVVGEGGPVPLGYGRVLVGSQVISSAYKVQDYTIPSSVIIP